MKKNIIILGSTGSIGKTSLSAINNNKNYKVCLLSTRSNVKKLYKQALQYDVKKVIIEDKISFNRYKNNFKKKKINVYLGHDNLNKIFKKKIDFCINSISGIEGLFPTLKIIPLTKNILIANKESIICGWDLIQKNLQKYKTNFIPIDSEHFSIWNLIKNEEKENIEKVILTASGGPFFKKKIKNISNIKPNEATRHPKWKMGKKISIDSSTMMNKIFEFIEAKKIFNLSNKEIDILIHPNSFVHAIIYFKGNLIKFLAHDTSMKIPISNALGIKDRINKNSISNKLKYLNDLNFEIPKIKTFPLLKILKLIPNKSSYFETILITLNDELVFKYLKGKINYISIQLNLLKLIKKPYFKRFYKLKPKNIYDIKNMIMITKSYLNKNLKYYE